MIFLYSRKSQFMLLLCWLIGMTVTYVQITGERPLWLVKAADLWRVKAGELWLGKAGDDPPGHDRRAQLGQVPATPAPAAPAAPAAPPAPAGAPRPAADPLLNRCLAMRVDHVTGERADTLIVEVDYVAAQRRGFAPEKARGYYLKDAPVFVIALGEPWTSDIGDASFPSPLPQISGLKLTVANARHLNLLIHTRSMRIARGTELHIAPTSAGIRAEVRLPH
jgi:hypothetical protein